CGKGRVDFFLSYQTRCQSVGIEYDERIYEKAVENRETAAASGRVSFELANAENFVVSEKVDCIYFFNPFSLEILQKVISRILDSYYEKPRTIQMFFYYPSDEYISYLMTVGELMFTDEIDCRDLFPGNDPRERILIFELPVDE
ncbi:MAG: class I SAM-dependent methyltransferase, partial [Lachnoclostridium sp.]|nr:class I SAM-dependent methyltransferase [Lachnoclostridium sp.]